MSSVEPVTREQVLHELNFLATVEHALIVEYLSVQCALGHDLPADQGGATTQALRDLAADFGRFAVHQMRHFKRVNGVLVRNGQSVQVERADNIAGIALGPPSAGQLERLVEREEHIAAAVDERYERLRPAVESETPLLEGSSSTRWGSSSTSAPITPTTSRASGPPWMASRRPTSCARPADRRPTRSSSASWRR